MPYGKGYMKGYGSDKTKMNPSMGNYGGGFGSTPSSDAGASGRSYVSNPSRNPKQKDSGPSGGAHRNLVRSGDYGNKGY